MASTSNSVPTRASAAVWLIGKPTESISHARLPSNGDVLKLYHFHHLEKKQTVKESVKNTVKSILDIWARARIPTQRIDAAERKLNKLLGSYSLLKKNRKSNLESCRMKENLFKSDLLDLFDIAAKGALKIMKNEDDKTFLTMQREDTLSCSMAGVDMSLSQKESRKRKRESEAENRKVKSKTEPYHIPCASQKSLLQSVGSSPCLSTSTSSFESSNEDFEIPSTSTLATYKKSTQILTEDVVATFDRVNVSDRQAMFLVGSVAQALGKPVAEIALSRSTIQRKRKQVRESIAESDKASFSPPNPLILHWDGKLLPDIVGGAEKVDRVAVIVSGGEIEKLLAVPAIKKGTGQEQATACLKILDDWQLRTQVGGLCFDTTASNTGLNLGACSLIEKSLNKELVWIACRHHVLEVILSDVFKALFGPSSGPDVSLFKRFQKKWPDIDQQTFTVGRDNLYDTTELISLRQEMRQYYSEAIKNQQARDDYLELLNLCRIFLSSPDTISEAKFRAPGALHQARWMAKAIYCLKMYLFQNQFTLTAKEKQSVTELCLFVSLIYGRYWNEAPLAAKAPLNDANFLAQVKDYPNQKIKKTALAAFCRHLWYFSEHLIGLSLFDGRINSETKREMVQNLQKPPTKKALKRLDGKTLNVEEPLLLQNFFTQRTKTLFDLLINDGQSKSEAFLAKDPSLWHTDEIFVEMQEKVCQMKVVNDCAERGIALIQKFNSCITKNEQQKQYLIRVVDLHRKKYPVPSKSNILKMNSGEKEGQE